MFDKILYKVHSNGQVGSWRIYVEQMPVEIVREACKVIGGKPNITRTPVMSGKNIGRSNETTPLEQAILEAESKYKKKMDEGYVITPPKTGDAVTNSLGFLKPMLAHPIDKVKKWDFPVYVQPKFDGHRMLATVQDGQVVLYSRQGKKVSVAHIRTELQAIFDEGYWDGTTLDGEIYQHGETLQRISSLVKKPKPESVNLVYNLYDVMYKTLPYLNRIAELSKVASACTDSIVITETLHLSSMDAINKYHAQQIGKGYEGTIIRHGDTGYEDGKRSKSLMKKKDFQDAEFKVINVLEGKPVIKEDKTYNVAIYECVTDQGKLFTCTAPGTRQEKHDAWVKRDLAIGRMLTVKFFNYTPDNIPFLPVALRLREDI